jgi:hypothetical protein
MQSFGSTTHSTQKRYLVNAFPKILFDLWEALDTQATVIACKSA